jgi:hypothetical protein
VVDAIVEQKDIDAVGIRASQLFDESGGSTEPEVFRSRIEWRITQSGKTWI